MLESLLEVADGFQRPWFGRRCLLAYLTVRTLGAEQFQRMGLKTVKNIVGSHEGLS